MHAPVCHQPARIIPEPPEIEMETIFVEGLLGRRPQPHVVIHPSRYWAVGFHRHRLHPSLIGPALHQTDLAQLTRLDIIDRVGILGAASLPLSYLNDFSIAFRSF